MLDLGTLRMASSSRGATAATAHERASVLSDPDGRWSVELIMNVGGRAMERATIRHDDRDLLAGVATAWILHDEEAMGRALRAVFTGGGK